eukprot:GILI01041959.1.p1 GENE.GILI01041959.1~~GILI01041959.1.p1  ORF type:complete len:189 (-),score=52.18 GILI01041959.1:15-521(-)
MTENNKTTESQPSVNSLFDITNKEMERMRSDFLDLTESRITSLQVSVTQFIEKRDADLKRRLADVEEREKRLLEKECELEEERKKWEEEREMVSSLSGNKPQWIKLNVGGKFMQTYRSTLTRVDGSLLAAMFAEHNEGLLFRDESGNYVLDRDPKAFELLLYVLRNYP